MRSAGNFHPQWGYLAPAPSFLRGARIVLVATAVGATAGAAVVVSLLGRPGADADNSIAAHALVSGPVSAAAGATGTPAPIAAAPASPLSASPSPDLSSASANSAAPGTSSDAPAQSGAGVAAVPSTTPATESAPQTADTAESKPTVPAKRFAGKRHRTVSNESFRRWQGEDAWRKRRGRDNGFPPLFRLFSSRSGSSDYPN